MVRSVVQSSQWAYGKGLGMFLIIFAQFPDPAELAKTLRDESHPGFTLHQAMASSLEKDPFYLRYALLALYATAD